MPIQQRSRVGRANSGCRVSDRLSGWLIAGLMVCCALPLLITTGVASTAWGIVGQHWGWVGVGLALIVVAVLVGGRRGAEP